MAGGTRLWTFVLIASVVVQVSYGQSCSAVDSQALRYFQLEIVFGGEEFQSWEDGTNCCTWEGVICNNAGHIESLTVVARHVPAARPQGDPYLVGTALADLTGLKNLTMFNVAYNGQIPPSWGGLSNLQVVNLDGCNVVGEIPEELCKLTNLDYLSLKGNLLGGTVPDCIPAGLSKLTVLDLSGNALVGNVPSLPGPKAPPASTLTPIGAPPPVRPPSIPATVPSPVPGLPPPSTPVAVPTPVPAVSPQVPTVPPPVVPPSMPAVSPSPQPAVPSQAPPVPPLRSTLVPAPANVPP